MGNGRERVILVLVFPSLQALRDDDSPTVD